MCLGSKPPTPPPPPQPAPLPEPPKTVDEEVRRARKRGRQQAALAEGREGSIVTSPLGLTKRANTARKSVLGG